MFERIFATRSIGLQHWKLAGTGAEREGLVEPGEIGNGEPEFPAARVFGGMLGAGDFGDREEPGLPHQEVERDLARGRVVRGGDFLQDLAFGRARTGKAAMTKRAVLMYYCSTPWEEFCSTRR